MIWARTGVGGEGKNSVKLGRVSSVATLDGESMKSADWSPASFNPITTRWRWSISCQSRPGPTASQFELFGGYRVFLFFFLVFFLARGFVEYYWVLIGLIGFYWVLPGFVGFFFMDHTRFYRDSPGFNGFYWVSTCLARYYLVLMSRTGFFLVLLGFIGW